MTVNEIALQLANIVRVVTSKVASTINGNIYNDLLIFRSQQYQHTRSYSLILRLSLFLTLT